MYAHAQWLAQVACLLALTSAQPSDPSDPSGECRMIAGREHAGCADREPTDFMPTACVEADFSRCAGFGSGTDNSPCCEWRSGPSGPLDQPHPSALCPHQWTACMSDGQCTTIVGDGSTPPDQVACDANGPCSALFSCMPSGSNGPGDPSDPSGECRMIAGREHAGCADREPTDFMPTACVEADFSRCAGFGSGTDNSPCCEWRSGPSGPLDQPHPSALCPHQWTACMSDGQCTTIVGDGSTPPDQVACDANGPCSALFSCMPSGSNGPGDPSDPSGECRMIAGREHAGCADREPTDFMLTACVEADFSRCAGFGSGTDNSPCCEWRSGPSGPLDQPAKCAGNAAEANDVSCGSGTQLIADATTTEQGSSPQTACCENLKCTGNTNPTEDISCTSGTGLIADATTTEQGSSPQTACCENLKCTGNTNPTEDISCTSGTGLIADATTTEQGSSPQTACCDANGLKCTGNAMAADDVSCSSGTGLIADAATTEQGSSPQTACCENLKCTGNAVAADDVSCSSGTGLIADAATTEQGSSPQTACCENLKCTGNAVAADDVSCSSGTGLIADAATTEQGSSPQTACCENLKCTGNAVAADDVSCSSGTGLIADAATTEQGSSPQTACCENLKCTGNAVAADDVSCSSGMGLIADAATTEKGSSPQTACCENLKCTGNAVAADDVSCSSGTGLIADAATTEKGSSPQTACCSECPAGKFSVDSTSVCEFCAVGRSSTAGSSLCSFAELDIDFPASPTMAVLTHRFDSNLGAPAQSGASIRIPWDIDNDGRADMFAFGANVGQGNSAIPEATVILNKLAADGSGTFDVSQPLYLQGDGSLGVCTSRHEGTCTVRLISPHAAPRRAHAAVGNFDGDDFDDLILVFPYDYGVGTSSNRVFLNHGDINQLEPVDNGPLITPHVDCPHVDCIGEDGQEKVECAGRSGDRANERETWCGSAEMVLAGDFNNDGRDDIIVIYFHENPRVFMSQSASPGTASYVEVTTGPLVDSGYNCFHMEPAYHANADESEYKCMCFTELGGTSRSNFYGQAPAVVADFNNDGADDLQLDHFVYHGDPTTNNFVLATTIPTLGLGGFDLVNGEWNVGITLEEARASADRSAADVNADGLLDIIAYRTCGFRNWCAAFIEIYLQDGEGNFSEEHHIAVGDTFCDEVVAGDLTSDGYADVICANYVNTNRLFINDRNGQFIEAPTVLGTTQDPTVFVAIMDMNLDGVSDAFLINEGADENSEVVLADVSSTGEYLMQLHLGAGGTPLQTIPNQAPVDISAADVNGDGLPDLVIAHGITDDNFNPYYWTRSVDNSEQEAGDVHVRLNKGMGTFEEEPVVISTTAELGCADIVVTGNFNSDGFADIATGCGEHSDQFYRLVYGDVFIQRPTFNPTVRIALSDGNGGFQESSVDIGMWARDIVAADLNNDGLDDLVIGHGYFVEEELFLASEFLGSGTTFFLMPDGRPQYNVPSSESARKVCLDEDNDPTTVEGKCNTVLFNDGTGDFTSLPVRGSMRTWGVTVDDFNEDGWMDIMFANEDVPNQILLNDQAGDFTEVRTGPVVVEHGCVPSYSITSHWEAAPTDASICSNCHGTANDNAGPLFKDGGTCGNGYNGFFPGSELVEDIWVCGLGRGREGLYDGADSRFEMTCTPPWERQTYAVGSNSWTNPEEPMMFNSMGSASCDFDGDGRPDLVVVNRAQPTQVFWGTADGVFETGPLLHPIAADAASRGPTYNSRHKTVATHDLDNNGRCDIIIASDVGLKNQIFMSRTGGMERNHFEDLVTLLDGPTDLALKTRNVVAADFNGDGFGGLAFAEWDSVPDVWEWRFTEDGSVSRFHVSNDKVMGTGCPPEHVIGQHSTKEDAVAACVGDCTAVSTEDCNAETGWKTCRAPLLKMYAQPQVGACVYPKTRELLSYKCPDYSTGSSSSTMCRVCDAGRAGPSGLTGIGSAQRYLCVLCAAGKARSEFESECVECTAGFAAAAGSAECTICEGALVTDTPGDGATDCVPCGAGEGPNADRTACEPCTGTQYSITGQCQDCAAPNVVGADRQTCTACAPGKEPNAERNACVDCTGTTYSQFGVQCQQCDDVVGPGAASCSSCVAGEGPNADRTVCEPCTGTQYSITGQCQDCAAPNVVGADRQTCTACAPGKEPNAERNACVDCTGTTYSQFGVQCQECRYPRVVEDFERTTCKQCQAGRGPSYDLSECTPCQGNNFSTFGVCQPCAAGFAADAQKVACEDVSTLANMTDVSVVSEVLKNSNLVPKTTLQMAVEDVDAVLAPGLAQDALIDDLVRDVAESLGIDPSLVKIAGLRIAEGPGGGRRRSQSTSDKIAFDVVISGSTAADSVQRLVEQVNDPTSPLMTSSTASNIDASATPVFDFECPRGTMRSYGDTDCKKCEDNKVTTDSESCENCPANQIPNEVGDSCLCKDSYYDSSMGFLACYGEQESFDELDLIRQDMVLPDTRCQECDSRCFTCVSGSVTLNTGFALSEAEASQIGPLFTLTSPAAAFRCPLEGCLGWVNSSQADSCDEGYTGALCAVCSASYIRSSVTCDACSETTGNSVIVATVCVLVVLFSIIGSGLLQKAKDCGGDEAAELPSENLAEEMVLQKASETGVLTELMAGSKILIGLLQVLTELPATLNLHYPGNFSSLLKAMKVFMLDVFDMFSIDCISPLSLHAKFVVVMLMPVVGLSTVQLIAFVSRNVLLSAGLSEEARAARKAEIRSALAYRSFFIVFMLYPLLSRTSFKMFSCHRLGPDEGWHPDDYNVDCDSGTHTGYRIAAVLGVLVYPVGIPVSFLCLLWHDEKTRIEKAKKTGGNVADQSSALDFLRSDYKGNCYYFEVIVLLEKLILTGLLIFINQGSTFQAFCGGVVAFSFFAVQCSTLPYVSTTDNIVKAVAEAQLFVTLFISVVLRTDASEDRDAITADQYGGILVVVFFAAPTAFLVSFIFARCCGKARRNKIAAYLPTDDKKVGDTMPLADHPRREGTPEVHGLSSRSAESRDKGGAEDPQFQPPGSADMGACCEQR